MILWKDDLTQAEQEGGETEKKEGPDLSITEQSLPFLPSSLPWLLALDQFTSYEPTSHSHGPDLVAEQPRRCFALTHGEPCGYWFVTLLTSAHTFPALVLWEEPTAGVQ